MTVWSVSTQPSAVIYPQLLRSDGGETEVLVPLEGVEQGVRQCLSAKRSYRGRVQETARSIALSEGGYGHQFLEPWDISAELAKFERENPPPPPAESPAPPNPPAPTPPPAPEPNPAPVPGPAPAPSGRVPAGAGSWQQYGPIWSFKVDELAQGPDGEWQAVISARSESNDKVGMTAGEIQAFLINADGETLKNWGELYKASSTGPASALRSVDGTLWMQRGDVVRFRIRFDGSREFGPVRFRIGGTGGSPVLRTFDMR
jgi:hypothetical protein